MALVSILIPCYNSERWIAQSIESALAQTWPEKEVIVVDDGSSDRTLDFARTFGDAVQLISTDHRGANHARNQAFAIARGEWIQFLDADDFLLPDKIERQFAEARDQSAADILYSPVWIDENHERRASELDPQLDIFSQWLSWQLPQTGGCLWKTTSLKAIGGWNEAMPCCQEHELYLRAIKHNAQFVFTPTPNAVYRIWSDATLCRRDPRQLVRVKTELFDEIEAWMKERKLWTDRHRLIAGRACFEMARTLAKIDLDEAVEYHDSRHRRDMIQLAGPGAPLAYRAAYAAIGFLGAEKLARAMR